MSTQFIACVLLVGCAAAAATASLALGWIAALVGLPLAAGLVLLGLRVGLSLGLSLGLNLRLGLGLALCLGLGLVPDARC